jgi:hypothetical protein
MSLTKNDRKIQSHFGNTFPSGSFAEAIAGALHREYDQRHAGVKTVVTLTGANERAVRNWFEAKNGPNGEFLIALCRHSDQVLDTVLVLAGRTEHVRARKLVEATDKLREMLRVIDDLGQDTDPPKEP